MAIQKGKGHVTAWGTSVPLRLARRTQLRVIEFTFYRVGNAYNVKKKPAIVENSDVPFLAIGFGPLWDLLSLSKHFAYIIIIFPTAILVKKAVVCSMMV